MKPRRIRGIVLCALALLGGRPAGAQEEAADVRLELRVIMTRPEARVVIDRGQSDGLEVGDMVVFRPRAGGSFSGRVIQVEDKSALVQLLDVAFVPENGTRGEVLIPAARLAEAEAAEGEQAAEEPVAGPLPWKNADEEWTQDQPLLAQARAVRPEERSPQITGLYFAFGDVTLTSDSERYDSFLRTGTSLLFENPYGRGGGLNLDAELNHRLTGVPDNGDESEVQFRFERLSYYEGGTRFEASRWEAGRFLQYGMPEFGILDGFEWGEELSSGARYGASVGFMPEPDPDFQSFEDFQVAAYYEDVFGRTRRLRAAAGFQKTLHHWDSDRDLFVGKVSYAPPTGWSYYATTWVDYYGSHDQAKGAGIELTRLQASASRRWGDEQGLDVALVHWRFPELDRDEFRPVTAKQLARDRTDRLSVSAWRRLGRAHEVHAQVGGWDDEDESGGDGELGFELRHLFLRDSRADATAFGSVGEFSAVLGLQLSYGRFWDGGGWDVFYEASTHDNAGFSSGRDDVDQHRLHASRDFFTETGWSFSFFGEALLWDEDSAWSAGFYLQKSF